MSDSCSLLSGFPFILAYIDCTKVGILLQIFVSDIMAYVINMALVIFLFL